MIKKETTNTFQSGLVMDLNPLTTPNDVVTNCLNGTILTYNGNEHVLLNDMGNARVETAFLPEGYVPLGTAELGGIIYIVSYNPLTDKCQIGSFPSPERNITSDEVSDLNTTLSESEFGIKNDIPATFYIKKELSNDIVLSPGDKFIVYGNTIGENYNYLYKIDLYSLKKGSKDLTKGEAETLIGTLLNLILKFDLEECL